MPVARQAAIDRMKLHVKFLWSNLWKNRFAALNLMVSLASPAVASTADTDYPFF
jgi:hypothetical protein